MDWAGLALLGSVGAYLAYLKGLGTGLDGGVAGITATVEPVIATLLGVVIMGDILEIWQVLGMAVVLLGVAFPWIRNKRGRNAEPAALEMEEEPGLK